MPGGQPSECSLYNPPPFQHVEASGADLLPIDHGVFWGPDSSQTTPGVFDDLDLPVEYLLDPLDKTPFLVGTIGPDQLESGKETFERFQQEFPPIVILDMSLVDKSMQDQPIRVDEQMPLAPFDFLAAVIAASPPFLARFH